VKSGWVVYGDVEQREQGGRRWLGSRVQPEQLRGNLLANVPFVVAFVEIEVGLEQIDDGKIRSGFSIRN
jgi:hypothetical protein